MVKRWCDFHQISAYDVEAAYPILYGESSRSGTGL
jgi:hypothetical protein